VFLEGGIDAAFIFAGVFRPDKTVLASFWSSSSSSSEQEAEYSLSLSKYGSGARPQI